MFAIKRNFYGDETRWFVGTVINNTPPIGQEGRVKIRINGIHNIYTGEIPESDLPWAQVLIPTTEGGISGIGRIPQMLPGSMAFGIFVDGKSSQIPLILGSLPRIELPTSTQNKTKNTIETFKYDQEKIIDIVLLEIDQDKDRVASVSMRRSQSVKFFIENGYTLVQASALTANLENASKFVLYSDNSLKQGIAGWTDGSARMLDLLDFSTMFNVKEDWKRFSVQLQFVIHELRNNKRKSNYKLKSSQTLEEAVEAIAKYYMTVPNNISATIQLAERAYEETVAT